ncbi:hypothetical protein [Jeotgalibacillus soli]|uniref:Uncharacterized protein n=1 Tax=Jeotgalibacillus soli TaxID=889306 RepID=A0A0C2R686_9BACL|nr:hypothetical protein [Jeotgalibacillus soli]KIL45770.1 hypothetical protein KP78_21190 [Jeotgalibacillus soli]
MIEKYTIDALSQDSVSIKKQQYAVVEGAEYPIGEPWRKAYTNSISGREELKTEVPADYSNAILMIWGETPTVVEAPIA